MVTTVDDLAAKGSASADGAALRKIPRTDQLLNDPRMRAAERRVGRDLVKAAIGRAQERARNAEITPDQVADAAAAELPATAASLTEVVNATGVLVHTNLGRAPLSQAAKDAMATAAGTCDVEFDLETGARSGQRGRGVIEALRRAVPGAQAAGVVNNNAAALVLAATALAAGREIIISRGELIEIGDRFRLPDLLASTGARLREVGTTNRTSVEDYQQAIGEDTGFILKVHPSNYRVEGFTREATVAGTRRTERHARPRHRLGAAGAAPAAPRRARRRDLPARRREPRHRQRRQATRRPAGRDTARRRDPGPPPAAPPARPRPARRQADPRRP